MDCCKNIEKNLNKTGGKVAIYACPMHPEITKDSPGLCSECGMQLVETRKKNNEYDKHSGHTVNIFKTRFWVSLVLSVPTVLYSGILETLFGFVMPQFIVSQYVPAVLSSVIFFYGGWIFLVSAVRELKAKMPGMMTLIALAITTAYVYSMTSVFVGGETLFWELATLITIMLLGHWLEMRAVQGAQGALRELSKLLPDKAEVITGGATKSVLLSELKEGDIILIRPGAKIPADSIVTEGKSAVNESMITGESQPVDKRPGDNVIAGTVNGSDGILKARVAKIGKQTFLAGIMRLVEEAQASKSRLQLLSDKAAFYLTLIAIIGGVAALLGWLGTDRGTAFAFERMVAVLVITCPHALGLAIPLVASISTTLAARNGFLVKQRLALEMARDIDTVIFDKTGTLTKGEYGVSGIWMVEAKDEKEVLQYASAVDSYSEHFIAKATVEKAKELGIDTLPASDFSRISGKGVRGRVGDDTVFCGGLAILGETGIILPEKFNKIVEDEGAKGKTVNFVVKNNQLLGILSFSDLIREESRDAIAELQKMGIKVAMLTGDSEGVAKWVAEELGIDEYFAKVLPGQKSDKVKLLQSKGAKVAMVGDGINDAPALTQADLGIAIGAGTNVAIESAGIILVRNDPRDIAKIIRLSKLTYSKMIQNLFWATGYNVVALPLAAGVLASRGILLQPAVAAVFMSLSTVIVAANAVLLKKKVL